VEYKKMAKKIILYVILVVLGISLTSCQTMQGVGGDIQWTAQKTAEAFGGRGADVEEERGGAEAREGKKAKAEESEVCGEKNAKVGEDRY
jgi:predicted small secreted protein